MGRPVTPRGTVVADPPCGPLLGTRTAGGGVRFAGVRYGVATRFARPEPAPDHHDPVDTSRPAPVCPQLPSRLSVVMGPAQEDGGQSEDCLFLAVDTPSLDGSRPVVVWLHGGAFLSGGGTLPWYDGGRLAADGDVVVVSVSYRIGALGFLVHPGVAEGNAGLHDQALALRWVRRNIAALGGDPERITVAGQSAGGLSTVALLSVPGTRDLVRRAVVQSAPGLDLVQDPELALEVGREFTAHVEGDVSTAPVGALLAAQAATLGWFAGRPGSTVEPAFGPSWTEPLGQRAQAQRVLLGGPLPDLLVGCTTQEGRAFGLIAPPAAAAVADAAATAMIAEPTRDLAARWAAAGGRVFTYEFAWEPERGSLGAVHCLELPFLLGTPASWASAPMLGATPWAVVDETGRPLRQAWARFAHDGSPGDDWPAWSAGSPVGRRIGPGQRPTA